MNGFSIQTAQKKALEVGWLGRFIGDRQNAPTRIAFILIMMLCVLIVPIAFLIAYRHDDSALLDKIVTAALSLLSGALGFVFGRSGTDHSDHQPHVPTQNRGARR
jgi:hypothetical protein